MLKYNNGVINELCKQIQVYVENFKYPTSDVNEGITENLDGFRGFEKIPVVKIERLDISAFLNQPPLKRICRSDKTQLDSKFFKKCSVKVIRADLQKLKNIFNTSLSTPGPSQGRTLTNSALCDHSKMRCKVCDKRYISDKKLQNHLENKHVIVYEPSQRLSKKKVSFSEHVVIHESPIQYHHCRKCVKIFEDYHSLKQHMRSRHKKRKCYICDYCSKSFVDRVFFKVHIKLHCDVCKELLPNKTKYIEHRRYVCKVIKFFCCQVCNENFYTNLSLKDHSYDHLDGVLICDYCKEQFNSKCTLAHHLSFLHCNRRSQELYETRFLGCDRVYLCKFCDETTVQREIIEQHVELLPDLSNRIISGSKDYYACDQCSDKFESEKELLQHKWSHFLGPVSQTNETTSKIDELENETYNANKAVSKDLKLVKDNSIKREKKKSKTLFSKHQCHVCTIYYFLFPLKHINCSCLMLIAIKSSNEIDYLYSHKHSLSLEEGCSNNIASRLIL